jgi:hypothetical protein
MEAESLTVEDVIAHIVADAADAVSCRSGESQQMQNDRVQAATAAIMTFRPRDVVEAMIASHCVMFHEVLVDSVGRLFRGEQTVSRSNILATDKAIGSDLLQLERYRSEHTAPEPAAQMEAIVAVADPAQSGDSEPNETWPTAAQMAGFNRQTRRAFDRKFRKRINQAARATERVEGAGPGVTSIHNAAATTASATSAG